MKNKKVIGILIVAFVVLMAGAYVLYQRLSGTVESQQLAVEETDEEAEVQGGTEEEAEVELAPDFTVYDAEGNAVSLSDFIGTPVVVNFWASWCGPCKSEMPDFEEAYQQYGEEIQFLIVNMTDGSSETVETAKAFIEEQGYTFPVYYDTDIDAAYTYGVSAIPTTYFIGADGSAVAYAQGMLDAATLQKGIDMIYPEGAASGN